MSSSWRSPLFATCACFYCLLSSFEGSVAPYVFVIFDSSCNYLVVHLCLVAWPTLVCPIMSGYLLFLSPCAPFIIRQVTCHDDCFCFCPPLVFPCVSPGLSSSIGFLVSGLWTAYFVSLPAATRICLLFWTEKLVLIPASCSAVSFVLSLINVSELWPALFVVCIWAQILFLVFPDNRSTWQVFSVKAKQQINFQVLINTLWEFRLNL